MPQTIDYTALAEQARQSVKSEPVDYSALAGQARTASAGPSPEVVAAQPKKAAGASGSWEKPNLAAQAVRAAITPVAKIGMGVVDAGAGMLRMPGDILRAAGEAPRNESEELIKTGAGGLGLAAKRMLIDPQVELARKSREANTGMEAFGYGIASKLPVIGPMAAHVAERVGRGEPLEAAGEGLGFLIAPRILGEIGAGTKATALRQVVGKRRPKDASAVQFAADKNIPVRASTATGNRVVEGFESGTKHVPLIGGRAEQGRISTEKALTQTGVELSADIGGATSKEMAGTGMQRHILDRVNALKSEADEAYTQVYEQAAKHVKLVQTRTSQQPLWSAYPESGPTKTVPVVKSIASPVNIGGIKQSLTPLINDIESTIPLAQREASPGYTALKQIMNSDDVIPLRDAIQNLQSIQRQSRYDIPAIRDKSQGIAAAVAEQLRGAVDRAAFEAGVLKELNKAREVAGRKIQTQELLEDIATKEPVRIVESLTSGGDKSIMALREIMKASPESVRDVARSTVEGVLQKATNDGGFKGAAAANSWNRLGDNTKLLLYGKARTKTLDDFFHLAKMESRDANPSGSARVVAGLTATGGLLIYNPLTAAGTLIGAKALGHLLYNERWAHWAVKAMKTPVKAANAPAAAMVLLSAVAQAEQAVKERQPQDTRRAR